MKKIKGFFTFLGVVFFFFIVVAALKGITSKEPIVGDRIGVVKVKGIIKESDRYIKLLNKLEKDKNVKAIILRVDSPGGVVGACQEIHDKVAEIAEKKPVVVSMGSVAASGGLYISVGATKIVANPGTITGSIGVIIQTYNFKKLADKLGVSVITVKSGRFKDILSPFREPKKEDIVVLKSLIEDSYKQFVRAVASGRKIPVEEVKKFADGRIFSGEKAKQLGLVDALGGLDTAVKLAKKLAKAPDAKVFEAKPERSLIQKLLGEKAEETINKLIGLLNGNIEEINVMYLLD